ECHVAGVCDATTGLCTNPAQADGTACGSDDDLCTADVCTAGVCSHPANGPTCAAADECHAAGICVPATGLCSNPPKADGASCGADSDLCTADVCTAGVCS